MRIGRRSTSSHVHDAAVAAHHHERHRDFRTVDRRRGHARGRDHLRQNRRVERRRARARAQAVGRAHVVPGRRFDPARTRVGHRQVLTLRPVHAETFARCDCFRTAGDQRIHAGTHGLHVARRCKRERRRERASRLQRHRPEAHPVLGDERDPAKQSEHADPGEIAFQKCVRRLRRGMRDERNRPGFNAGFFQQTCDALDDAGRDALRCVVRRRGLDPSDEPTGRGVDRDHVGKRAADVYADAQRARRTLAHALTKSAASANVTIASPTAPSRSKRSKSASRSARSAAAFGPAAGRYDADEARPNKPSRSSRLHRRIARPAHARVRELPQIVRARERAKPRYRRLHTRARRRRTRA